MVVSSNAGTPFAEIGATGVALVAPGLPARRPRPRRADARAGRRGRRPRRGAHGRHPGRRHEARRSRRRRGVGRRRPGTAAGELRSRRTTTSPASEKAPTWGPRHRLARRADRPAGRGQGRAPRRGRARGASQAGASAVWVSNHGGRQLDRAVATADACREVVAAVGDDAEVYVDGGSALRSGRRSTALALGADARLPGSARPLLALAEGERRRGPDAPRAARPDRRGAAVWPAARTVADTRGTRRRVEPQTASDLRKRVCGPPHVHSI